MLLKRPDNYLEIAQVSFKRSGPYVDVIEAFAEGVHMILDQRNHWYRWSKVKRARKAQ
jgi:hypothetical protein